MNRYFLSIFIKQLNQFKEKIIFFIAYSKLRISTFILGYQSPYKTILLDHPSELSLYINPTSTPSFDLKESVSLINFTITINPLVSIVIYNNLMIESTLHCLLSIYKNIPKATFEILILDNIFQDSDRNIINKIEGVQLIKATDDDGLGHAFNNCSKYAKGRFLQFLNSHSIVTTGWLDHLLNIYQYHSDCGIVGSKVINHEGLIIEAIGISSADGSIAYFGRGEDNKRSTFNYVSEVDFCSVTSFIIEKEVFCKAGQFDIHHNNINYQLSDLSNTLRIINKKSFFQHLSIIILQTKIERNQLYQTKSDFLQSKNWFYNKWKHQLLFDHFPINENLFFSRDRSNSKKNILIIDHYIPQPDRDAGSRSIRCFIDVFQKIGLNVKLWPENLHYDSSYAVLLQQEGIEIFYGHEFLFNFDSWSKHFGQYFDYVFLNRPHISIKFIHSLKKHFHGKLLYYGHDLHFLRLESEYNITGDKRLLKSSKVMKNLETSIWRLTDVNYYPSMEEVHLIKQLNPKINVKCLQPYYFKNSSLKTVHPTLNNDIIFVAGFSHPPNIDAALWLVNEIMPLIWAFKPLVTLTLVGSNPSKEVLNLATERVIITGYVTDDNLNTLYSKARLVVVPLRFGGGVKNKILEAMSKGIPVITTSAGIQGLPELTEIIPVRNSSKEFSDSVLYLFENDTAWIKTSTTSIRYIQENYSINSMIDFFKIELNL